MKTASRIALAAVLAMLLLLPLAALATGKPPAQAPGPATASATATAHSTSASTAAAHAAGGSVTGSVTGGAMTMSGGGGGDNLYVLPAPIGGSNLPAGMCQRSRYNHVALGWNLVSVAEGDSHTDMECLRLLAELERLKAQPLPVKPTHYTMADTPQRPTHAMQAEAVCPVPAKAKSVQAARAAGACR